MNLRTKQYIKDLDNSFELSKSLDNDEAKAMLAKLLCLRVAALPEVYIKARISEYGHKKVPTPINKFINHCFRDITNLKSTKLIQTLEKFSKDWSDAFNSYLEANQKLKTSLNSLMELRHNIAHGQPMGNSTITKIEDYYTDVKEVINHLDLIIK